MQETNGSFRKSLETITAQNTNTVKQLNIAQEKALNLELQLRKKQSNPYKIAFIIASIITIALFLLLILRSSGILN